ncbi:hypothetical protein D3C76_1431930 [compost metagenome]
MSGLLPALLADIFVRVHRRHDLADPRSSPTARPRASPDILQQPAHWCYGAPHADAMFPVLAEAAMN